MTSTTTRLERPHLRSADVLRLAGTGLRARPMRAFLSALGIAIGIAAMIAVVGVSTSRRPISSPPRKPACHIHDRDEQGKCTRC